MSFFEDLGNAVEKVGTTVVDGAASALKEVAQSPIGIINEMRGVAGALPADFPGAELFGDLLNNPLETVAASNPMTGALSGLLGKGSFFEKVAAAEDGAIGSISDGYLNTGMLSHLIDLDTNKIAVDLAGVENRAMSEQTKGYINGETLADLVSFDTNKIAARLGNAENRAMSEQTNGYIDGETLADLVSFDTNKIATRLGNAENRAMSEHTRGYFNAETLVDLVDMDTNKIAADLGQAENRGMREQTHGLVDGKRLSRFL